MSINILSCILWFMCYMVFNCVAITCSMLFRYINSVNRDEMNLIQDVAFDVVRQHQRHMVVSPWALMATVLIQNREGISVLQLVKETDWLKRQAQNYGAYVDWPGMYLCVH